MSKYKKQHFVPQSYLKSWCDPNCPLKQTPYVWLFSSDGTESRKKAPSNIFYETDMYTIKSENGERDLILEHGLQQLESKFSRIRRTKFKKKKPLTAEEHLYICAFIAATHSRTKTTRDHWKKNWKQPLKKTEELIEWAKTASSEDKKRLSHASSFSSRKNKQTISYEQIKELHENPLQTMLSAMVTSLTPMLSNLNMVIIDTKGSPGFITSDNPCVWFDPEAYKRPPLYRAPALIYPSLEITLPISPSQTILLSRHDYTGHINANSRIVDEFNRRTRFNANEHFVVNDNIMNRKWFESGEEPLDSWEKVNRIAKPK